MKRVFEIPDPIVVPDGTELHEVIGPQILTELGLRSNDGVSVAIGKLPAGIKSKVHVHPVVWHFTWVRKGTLTVKMKDSEFTDAYELTIPKDRGVMTEAGTFFQLINRSDEPCEVYYIVGPAFVFELGKDSNVLYNDAVVLEHSWEKLAELQWSPPELPPHWKMHADRMRSLYRTAPPSGLSTVNFHRWKLMSGPGSVSVPSPLHNRMISPSGHTRIGQPLNPDNTERSTEDMIEMAKDFVDFLTSGLNLTTISTTFTERIESIIDHKCNQKPSLFDEFSLATALYQNACNYINPEEVWHLLIFGKHDELQGGNEILAIQAVRYHVFNDLLRYAVSIGGGFKSAGAMENYRGYMGGTYSNSSSYRHYRLKEAE